MALIRFDNIQTQAMNMAMDWIRTPQSRRKKIFTIAGYAGSGKSTVLSQIINVIGLVKYRVAFVTYTGKAAVVLRQKGLNAYTIHKLIYNTSISKNGIPIFKKKKQLPHHIELIVVDEVGMVPQQIIDDLASYGIPILCTGDPGQLSPIYGDNTIITSPDITLKKVYRQGKLSGILSLATDIRNGICNFNKTYGDDVNIVSMHKFKQNDILNFDQILCSTNNTRSQLNIAARTILKRKSQYPEEGDKIICTANNFKEIVGYYDDLELYMVNGLLCYCDFDASLIDDNVLSLKLSVDGISGIHPTIYCKANQFMNNYDSFGKTEKKNADKEIIDSYYEEFQGKQLHTFDYGFAITCHKSQGSQWDNVIIFDDCFYNTEENYLRWMYTAVTRAIKTVTIVTGIN
jgi:exodeoxyribonuclease-5